MIIKTTAYLISCVEDTGRAGVQPATSILSTGPEHLTAIYLLRKRNQPTFAAELVNLPIAKVV